ncbi:LOW QUALITY PROTEIN: hypothetical protein CFC21_054482 [Triticum aestivum]|uniref:Uncharacterized protein n=2 Tax=Triticum aestivum TaxID=4565 RepID=A0A9R1K908_WHEAT|nr:LOW QUALITY PROTEIN: hypothetical protein CFC21_054482 [Triticum aestivum]
MDKLLAFSILSASPADIAPGAGGSWARVSWRGRKLQDDDRAGAAGKEGKQGGLPVESEGRTKGKSQSPLRPRFAPEFDGTDCFQCH